MPAYRNHRASVRDIVDLAGPPLQLILQHACSEEPAQRICNLLSASKALRSAVLEHGTGTAELTCTSAQYLNQLEALAAWLATHGHLLGSLDFSAPTIHGGVTIFSEEERDTAEKAVASAFSTAASAVAHRGGLQLQTCRLTYASPRIAELVQQLPSHSLTRLTLKIFQPESTTAQPLQYITGLSSSLQHLTSLRQLLVKFSSDACLQDIVVDPLLQQLSALTNLTSLALSNVLQADDLRHLPASLKDLTVQIDIEAHSLNLRHLTALTRLATDDSTWMKDNYILPPNLLELDVGDLFDVACVLPLTQLKVLRLQECNMVHPEAGNLQQLSHLTQLESVDLQYSCEGSSVINNAANAWKLLPMKNISLSPWGDDLSHHTIAQLEHLTKLTGLTLRLDENCKLECTPNDFARALCKLRNLQQLCLYNCMLWQDNGGAIAMQLNPVYNAFRHLQRLEDLWIDEMPISCKAAKHLAKSLAGQLTCLTLRDNDVSDCDVNAMLLSSPRLVQLNLANNPLTNGILPVIAAACTGLESLHWSRGTEITDEGVKLYLPHLLP